MGWLRDILGAAADGLAGEDNYGNWKKDKMRSEAMAGFADDPLGAIKRLQERGFGDDALNLYKTYQDNEIRRAAAQSTAQNRMIDNNRGLDPYVGGLLASANETTWPSIRGIIGKLKETRGYDFPFELPDTWDENTMAPLRMYGRTQGNNVSEGNNIRTTSTSRDNNIRTTETSRDNNIRTTTTSAANNQRTTATSAANNQRTTATSAANNERTTTTSRTNNERTNQTRRETAGSGSRTPPALPPFPPTRVGDRAQGPSGVFVSRDGKTWVKAN